MNENGGPDGPKESKQFLFPEQSGQGALRRPGVRPTLPVQHPPDDSKF